MAEKVVRNKSFEFALKIVEIYKYLISIKKEYVLSKQILRSGTAIGALIREAEHAESKKDFIHKLAIAQKEANETDYWLELLFQSYYLPENYYKDLHTQIDELQRIIAKIIITTKNKYDL